MRRACFGVFGILLAGCASTIGAPSTSSTMPVDSTPVVTVVTSRAPNATSLPAPAGTTPPVPTTTIASPATTAPPPAPVSPFARPDWLGTRVLAVGPDGKTVPQQTPPELRDRHLETIDRLPPPPDEQFISSIGPLGDDVVARSTWSEECPVGRDELAYLTVSHMGFDGEFHTGEIIVNAAVAADVVAVFARLHAAGFPIEEMRVISRQDLDAPPTGDGNTTSGFVCRPGVGSKNWSQHAFGLAVDINPFHNPYAKGDVVLPELATFYLDREPVLDGMVVADTVAVEAFGDIGWAWGGNWNTLKDWMHFSLNGN
jgi:hypothetical protein